MANAPLADAAFCLLEERGVVTVGGPEAATFLQGLITNDVRAAAPERAIYAALLTPQGRYLHDFMVALVDGVFHLDCEAARRADLLRRLSLYKLRSQVTLADATDRLAVAVLYGPGALSAAALPAEPGRARALDAGLVYVDPRLADLGARAFLPRAVAARCLADLGLRPGDPADYDRLRLSLGVPDGSRDLVVEKSIPLESGFDELHAIGWDKGCYLGQELTARTKYRGLVRKRLLPVAIDGPVPPVGTPILQDDAEVGDMRSARADRGLALLRLDSLAAADLRAGAARLRPAKPSWFVD
jgi:folate-binding protein YgfZ